LLLASRGATTVGKLGRFDACLERPPAGSAPGPLRQAVMFGA
jgi:hypothetical protein